MKDEIIKGLIEGYIWICPDCNKMFQSTSKSSIINWRRQHRWTHGHNADDLNIASAVTK